MAQTQELLRKRWRVRDGQLEHVAKQNAYSMVQEGPSALMSNYHLTWVFRLTLLASSPGPCLSRPTLSFSEGSKVNPVRVGGARGSSCVMPSEGKRRESLRFPDRVRVFEGNFQPCETSGFWTATQEAGEETPRIWSLALTYT